MSRTRPVRALQLLLPLALLLVPAAGAGSGSWQRLPAAPVAPVSSVVSVWTGTRLIVFGRAQPTPPWSVDAAASYEPATRTWRRLAPLHGPTGNYEGRYWAAWTGKEMLVTGPFDFQAFDPAANRWRRLPQSLAPPGGIVVWTGRELLGWGGGCCGDASADGAAYNPVTNRRRALAPSPLAPEQRPTGVWTGRELLLFVRGVNPADGKPWPARLARAAAYNPVTDTWRRIATLPEPRAAANAVWDGREALVVGGAGSARAGFAYDPGANRWRRLPATPSARAGGAAVWTGRQLLLWGGTTSAPSAQVLVTPTRGAAYDPKTNRWSTLPPAPLLGRLEPTAVWTGRAFIVWGGQRPKSPLGTGTRVFADGAAFSP